MRSTLPRKETSGANWERQGRAANSPAPSPNRCTITPRSPISRHDWLWLTSDWESHAITALERSEVDILTQWIEAKRPLIAARSQPGDPAHTPRLGLALPGKRRIGLAVAVSAIADHRPPLPLRKALGAAPLNWREPLGELSAELEAVGEEACVYGSLAWQYWSASSGTAYLTASSDVDLLFRPMSWGAVLKIVSVLERFERQHHAPRPDGEIVLPDGDAIAWREISNHPPKVLAKGMNSARLRDMDSVRSVFEDRV